jgi:SAM-dependent methyltransferase
VEQDIASQLLALNRQFYQTMGVEFSATRTRLQPGVGQVLTTIPPSARILDLGCGNGELARQLARRNFNGLYIGLDFSPVLLQHARGKVHPLDSNANPVFRFTQADLATESWEESLIAHFPAPERVSFDLILAFAVLHHLPGRQVRTRLLHKVRQYLSPSGSFIHSVWQFLNSPRLQARIQPWENAGLSPAQVDPDDYLLDWRRGGSGLRYVHHFSLQELDDLAAETGFSIQYTFVSDGEAGKLGLYQFWSPLGEHSGGGTGGDTGGVSGGITAVIPPG